MVATRDLFNDPRPQPRDYQVHGVAGLLATLRQHGIAACESATGTGKTLMQAMLSEHYGRTLFVAPQINLTHQLAAGVEAYRLRGVEIEQEMNWASPNAQLIAASLDTLLTGNRAERLGKFDLVVVDEMHYGLGEQCRAMLDRYRAEGAHVCGFTATPHVRPDGSTPLHYYGHCPVQYGVVPAIAHGWLVPLKARRVVMKGLDYSKVPVFGEFDQQSIEKILRSEQVIQEQAALVAANHDKRRSGAVYCSSIATAEAFRAMIEMRHGINCALVHSKMPAAQRAEELKRFESGEATLIANVAVLRMGWDSRRCTELHILKPTSSLPAYIQTVGRALRPNPEDVRHPTEYLRRLAIKNGTKPEALIIDYTDTTRHHRVCSAIDVMLPPAKVQKYREKLLRHAEEEDVTALELDAAIKAEEKRERDRALAEQLAEKERRRQLVLGVTFDAHSIDPFAKPTAASPSRREPRMLWGPYKGQPIRLIPASDLKRIFKGMRRTPGNEWLVKAIKRELEKVARP
jgi:superfamily II DNA or RNA helicase